MLEYLNTVFSSTLQHLSDQQKCYVGNYLLSAEVLRGSLQMCKAAVCKNNRQQHLEALSLGGLGL